MHVNPVKSHASYLITSAAASAPHVSSILLLMLLLWLLLLWFANHRSVHHILSAIQREGRKIKRFNQSEYQIVGTIFYSENFNWIDTKDRRYLQIKHIVRKWQKSDEMFALNHKKTLFITNDIPFSQPILINLFFAITVRSKSISIVSYLSPSPHHT